MDDRFNTIAGWVLFAGIVALGSSIVAGEMFHHERPEEMGFPIAGVEPTGEGAEAEKPIAVYLASADAAKGQSLFNKCTACHNAAPGGPNALGPNLHGILGAPVASKPGFAYTDALKSKGGTWTWDAMSAWLKSPKAFAPGTKMTFAGISDPQDRANLLAWLNTQGSSLALPAVPKETEQAAGAGDGAQTAEKEPVPSEQQAAKSPKNSGGDAAGQPAEKH